MHCTVFEYVEVKIHCLFYCWQMSPWHMMISILKWMITSYLLSSMKMFNTPINNVFMYIGVRFWMYSVKKTYLFKYSISNWAFNMLKNCDWLKTILIKDNPLISVVWFARNQLASGKRHTHRLIDIRVYLFESFYFLEYIG